MTDNGDVATVLAAIAETIGVPETWTPYPGGYPNEVEAALIDSVFSLRAVYGTSAGTGVRHLVHNWRTYVARPLNSLSRLVADVDAAGGPQVFKSILGSAAVAVPNAKDKPTKATAVYGTACTLVQLGLDSADDVRKANHDRPVELHRAITKERGLGDAAATYFLMLLHVQGIKADVMIRRFMARALGEGNISPDRAKMLAEAAAVALHVDMLALDHAIWDRESRLAADLRRRRR
jgi:hypothetical protein